MATKKAATTTQIIIPPANMRTMSIKIVGTAPFVQNKFSAKAALEILSKQIAGSTAGSKKKRSARDIDDEFKNAMHIGEDGTHGIPCSAFRSAMISACRLVGFQMTKAKLSVFVQHDTIDETEGTGLVRLISDKEPELNQSHVRLESGVTSIAIRPMWREWAAVVKVKWDSDQFTQQDVINLMSRAGQQVGVGEGRPDSKKSHGMGWGTFEVQN